MSDSNKPKPLPPDDFSATTPNIKLPNSNTPNFGNAPVSDWEKTNYNYNVKDLQGGDQWNKPAFTPPQTPQIIPPNNPPIPPANTPKVDEWGMTQANINLPFNNQPNQNQPPPREDFGSKQAEYGATTPFINLPKDLKEQYQSPPKFKLDEEEEEKEQKKKGGIPGWIWGVLGLLFMFFFSLIVLGVVWYFFLNKTGVEVVLKGAPPRSDILIDGSNWGVTSDDGTIRLQGLRAGETKKIEIKNANFKCEPQDIKGTDGESIPMIARCTSTGTTTNNTNNQTTTAPPKECLDIKPSEIERSRKCANDELDKLEKAEKEGKMFNAEQVTLALNLYIILFPVNDYKIVQPKDKDFIRRAAEFIKKLPPSVVIEVGGHTDTDGGDKKNIPLSENRATAVRNALVENGVNSIMLRTKGYSSTQPRAANDTPENKFRNRRIQYTVISQ